MSAAEATPVLAGTARRLLAVTARAQVQGRLPSLVTAVVRADDERPGPAWAAGRGSASGAPDGAAPDADVQYRIGSITKVFTAVLVMRLRDEGRLALDTPVDDVVPGTPLGGRTVGQLLGHGAGLQAETSGPWWERTPGGGWEELVAPLGPDALRHPAGRRFHYSNTGYGVLGRVVEALRGRSWLECLQREVLAPLELARTSAEALPPAAPGLAVHPWAPVTLPEPAHSYGAMAAAGQLWSTAADLCRWARFLLGDTGGVLAPATVEEMAAPGLVDELDGTPSSYGLGLQVVLVGGRRLVGHGGSVPGFLASLLVDPEERTGAVALTNATSGMDPALVPELLGVVREAEPRVLPPWTPLAAGAAATAPLDALGPWYWGPTPFVLVLRDDGLLELRGLGGSGRASRFAPVGEGVFRGLDAYYDGELLRVVREGSAAPSHLDVGSFVLTRTPYEDSPSTPGGGADGGWGG